LHEWEFGFEEGFATGHAARWHPTECDRADPPRLGLRQMTKRSFPAMPLVRRGRTLTCIACWGFVPPMPVPRKRSVPGAAPKLKRLASATGSNRRKAGETLVVPKGQVRIDRVVRIKTPARLRPLMKELAAALDRIHGR
jgi:hypothetical protein